MNTDVLQQQTKNANKKRHVSWVEGLEWKQGEEEKRRTRKALFKKRRVGVKREKNVARAKEEQAEWDVDKAEFMYYYLIDRNSTVYQKIAEVCVRDNDARNALVVCFVVLGMGHPDAADIKSIASALSKFGVLEKTANDAHEQGEKKTGNDDGLWDAWNKHVLEPFNANKRTPPAAYTLSNLLTHLSKCDSYFEPRYCDLTPVASSEKNRSREMCDAGDLVKDLSNATQQVCVHYAYHKNPDNPISVIQHLVDNWNLDKREGAPPIERLHGDGSAASPNDGGSAASSLSGSHGNTLSPPRKKMKSSAPVETANNTPASLATSKGKTSMTKDEHY